MSISIINSNFDNNINLYNFHNNTSSNSYTHDDLFNQNISILHTLYSSEYIPLSAKKKHEWLLNKLAQEKLSDFIPLELHRGNSTEITFLHRKCNKTFKETPHNFFRRKHKCPHCDSDKFILSASNNETTIKEKNNIVQQKMNLIYKGEFKFIRINPNDKFTVELQHSKCGKTFKDYRRKIYTDKIQCPYCRKKNNRNKLISNKDRIKHYEDRLQGKFKILEGFVGQKQKIKLQRVSCGHIITRSLNSVLRKDYKDICPECDRLKRLNFLTTKLKDKYNGEIEVVNGLEKFQNNQTTLIFFHSKCEKVFSSSFHRLLSSHIDECPNCKNNNSTNSLKNEVYNKYKGEYTVAGKYIDSKTPVLFRHSKCRHVFTMTKTKFFQSKIPCKHCRNKSRSLGLNKAQEKVNAKFGKLFTLNGIYINSKTELPVTCNQCNTVENISLNKLMNRKKCPHCKTTYK